MTGNIVITGANRGIGLAMTQQYAAQGYTVYAVCRTASSELNAISGVNVIDGVDVVQDQDLQRLQTLLADIEINILINNAGILSGDSLGNMDFSGIERQLQVNAIGPLKVTDALLSRLTKGSKVALITSRMGSMSDNGSGGYYGYRMSKAALNAAGVSLSQDLKSHGIAVGLFHPGFVQTEMVNHSGDISATEAASRLLQRIDELNINNTGSFRHSNGVDLPW